jgi:hypothetical protein
MAQRQDKVAATNFAKAMSVKKDRKERKSRIKGARIRNLKT